jgi:hypothetical protein
MISRFPAKPWPRVFNFGTLDQISTLTPAESLVPLPDTDLNSGQGTFTIQKRIQGGSSGENVLIHFGLTLNRVPSAGGGVTLHLSVFGQTAGAMVTVTQFGILNWPVIFTVTYDAPDNDVLLFQINTDNSVNMETQVNTVEDLAVSFCGTVILPYP